MPNEESKPSALDKPVVSEAPGPVDPLPLRIDAGKIWPCIFRYEL